MAEDEVGTLGPKDVAGIGKDYLVAKANRTVTVAPAPGAPKVSKPDLQLPDPEALEKEKLFPVKLLRGYRPRSTHFMVGHYKLDDDGAELAEVEYEEPMEVPVGMDEGHMLKLKAGSPAMLPVTEAREVIRKGIAERADAIN